MWSFFVDRGGTFTDLIAKTPTGEIQTAKVLSENAAYEDAAVYGISKHFLKVDSSAQIPPNTIEVVRVGTTVATNALLERRGAPTIFVTTKGFRDSLRIGHQARPDLFARQIKLHSMLYEEDLVVEVDERVGANGEVVKKIEDLSVVKQDLTDALKKLKIRYPNSLTFSAAVVFVHGFKYPEHEKIVAQLATEVGFTEVCSSHVVSPIIRFVPRGDTTVVDSYVTPAIVAYANKLKRLLPAGTKLQFMQSSGGLADAAHFRGKDAVLSGPAGGVVGMVESALEAGVTKIVGFDMGGTSTDVSHFAGHYERSVENVVSGIRVRAPMMSIHTIAAGGGSILGFDGSRLLVGPHSAGANPGPACYRLGGPLTITDANVLLGRIQPEFFPSTFGPNANEPIDVEIVTKLFDELRDKINLPDQYADPMKLAQAFLDLAAIQMADAVKKMSVQKGCDITRDGYVLQCFGGAGGQHACAVADALGLKKVMIHPCAGVLSAYGIGLARASCTKMKSLDLTLPKHFKAKNVVVEQQDETDQQQKQTILNSIHALWNDLEKEALFEIGESRSESSRSIITTQKSLLVRYVGGDVPLEVFCPPDLDDLSSIWKDFEEAYNTRYSHLMPKNDLVITVANVEVIVDDSLLRGVKCYHNKKSDDENDDDLLVSPVRRRTASTFVGGKLESSTPLFSRSDMCRRYSSKLIATEGSIIVEDLSTTFVDKGWTGRCDDTGVLWLEKSITTSSPSTSSSSALLSSSQSSVVVDPLRLEVMGHLFMNIAEQMGLQLQNTAWSVNIKERLDFSCAIFTSDGLLVANAPHMPVHLGSMGLSIKSVLNLMEELRNRKQDDDDEDINNISDHEKIFYSEDIFIVNDPFAGGTHLPDITLISPVFVPPRTCGHTPDFFVASRGHHADIGGATPGSLPPFSKHIDEEGVRFSGFRWRTRTTSKTSTTTITTFRDDETLKRKFMEENPSHPARNFEQNLGDLLAQVAANETGAKQLLLAVEKYGLEDVKCYMNHLLDFGEKSVRRALFNLPKNLEREGKVELDNGAVVKVKLTLKNDVDHNTSSARIDFTGSSGLLNNNFNAPRAVTFAAVLYSVRLLVNDNSLPLNEGCLRPLEIIVPEDSCCLSAQYPAPVVAGNVEMSMCVTNAILHAFGAIADSQPTMNNFTFGTSSGLQYYETICGGGGAGPMKLNGDSTTTREGFNGASAIQSHMTNSRLTDVEVFESRFPVRLEFFEIARGTGGEGRFRGGDGTRRCVRFLEPKTTVCLLSNGRKFGARGLDGGENGQLGKNILIKKKQEEEELESLAQIEVEEGDCILIQTPGGGGFLKK